MDSRKYGYFCLVIGDSFNHGSSANSDSSIPSIESKSSEHRCTGNNCSGWSISNTKLRGISNCNLPLPIWCLLGAAYIEPNSFCHKGIDRDDAGKRTEAKEKWRVRRGPGGRG